MKNKINFLISILTFLIVSSISASASEQIKIGLLLPLSGENKNIGTSVLRSVSMAVNKIDSSKLEILPKNKDKNIIEINEITARLEIDKKSWATAFANKGVINITEKTAEMVGSVKIKGFEKIQIEASDLKIFYQNALAETKKPVFMKGKFGIIQAGSAEFHDMNQ